MVKFAVALACAVLLLAVSCTRKVSDPQLLVEIPAGFNGNFVLDMGVHDAAPLPMNGSTYILALPRDGKVQTSTLLNNPKVIFKNSTDGRIWGYSQRVFTTGDGIAIGGKIEFFVGTQKEFEAEQNKKNKSDEFSGSPWGLLPA